MDKILTGTDSVQPRRRTLALGLASALLGVPLVPLVARSAVPPTAATAAAAPPLTLALIELMPWAATNRDGSQTGILVDTADALSTLSGVDLQLRLLPYARGAMMLKQRQIDLMVALQADLLDQVATRLAPLSMEDIIVVSRPGTVLRAMSDLKGKVVGRLRNAEYAAEFAASTDIIKYDTSSYRQSLQMLRIGRLDAVIFTRSALLFTLKSMQLTAAAIGQPLLLGRMPLTMYATHACAATASGDAIREACKSIYRRQTVKGLAELLNMQSSEPPTVLSWHS